MEQGHGCESECVSSTPQHKKKRNSTLICTFSNLRPQWEHKNDHDFVFFLFLFFIFGGGGQKNLYFWKNLCLYYLTPNIFFLFFYIKLPQTIVCLRVDPWLLKMSLISSKIFIILKLTKKYVWDPSIILVLWSTLQSISLTPTQIYVLKPKD